MDIDSSRNVSCIYLNILCQFAYNCVLPIILLHIYIFFQQNDVILKMNGIDDCAQISHFTFIKNDA